MKKSLNELAARFSAYREHVPVNPDGKRKKFVYPADLRGEASRLYRSDPQLTLSRLAKTLGISESGLRNWLGHRGEAGADEVVMIPVQVSNEHPHDELPITAAACPGSAGRVTVTKRELTVTLPSGNDREAIGAILKMLTFGGAVC